MKIVGIFALWATLVFSNIANADVHGFAVEPWQDCVRQAQCETLQPKEWTAKEISFLDKTISKFKKNGLEHLINKVQSFNFKSFQRTAYWFYLGAPTMAQPFGAYARSQFIHAITESSSEGRFFVFTDRFFNGPLQVDPISKVDLKEITLLHELVHAFDSEGNKWSMHVEFRQLVGFIFTRETGFNIDVYKYASVEELNQIDSEIDELNSSGKEIEAHNLDRKFGMALGLPRHYSTTNPEEAFADVVTFIYFDKTAPNYMSKELIQYIDKNVLKGARAK